MDTFKTVATADSFHADIMRSYLEAQGLEVRLKRGRLLGLVSASVIFGNGGSVEVQVPEEQAEEAEALLAAAEENAENGQEE